jgi:hypothetical protein
MCESTLARDVDVLASLDGASLSSPFTPFLVREVGVVVGALSAVHVALRSPVGAGPADPFAPRHVDPDGVPPAPLP